MMFFIALSLADVFTAEDLCQRGGDPQVCRLAELERRIAATRQFGPEGKFEWRFSDSALDQIPPQNIRERAGRQATSLCTHVARTWVSNDVAEYERSTSFVAVDRDRFDECIADELPKAKKTEREKLVLQSSKVVAVVLVPVIVFLMFWYRRPLARQIRGLAERIRRIGAQ
jgi:hypothetical protein